MIPSHFVLAFFFTLIQRSSASAPDSDDSFFEGYPHFIYHLPEESPIASDEAHIDSPASVLHAPVAAPLLLPTQAFSPSFYPFFPYSAYPEFYPAHEELHNVAGTIKKEDELLTDVSLRFPARKAAAKKLAMNKK
ncbi:hypothetical protein Aduo_001612 [Ancylostoma duodenale]